MLKPIEVIQQWINYRNEELERERTHLDLALKQASKSENRIREYSEELAEMKKALELLEQANASENQEAE